MENKKSTYAIVLVAMLLGVLIGLMTAPNLTWMGSGRTPAGAKLPQAVDAFARQVLESYVDSVDLNSDSMTARMMSAMLAQLDPHSYYITAKETEFKDETKTAER